MHLRFPFVTVVVVIALANAVSAQTATQNPASENQAAKSNTSLGILPSLDQIVAPATPIEPAWLPSISSEHHQFIGQILDYWQTSSDDVKQYQCEFTRYDYDTTFCNWRDPKTNQLAAASIMTGEIRFAAPDKACYETTKVYDFALDQEKQTPDYKQRDDVTNREKWICDGAAIFEFDYQNKRLYETEIPVELQGKGLVNSPIPFLFGASKDDVLNRFWVRTVTPNGVQDEYWLEAVPKKIDDSRNYSKIELVISRTEFLPVMLHVYAPNYDPALKNFTSRVFEFKNRKVNSALAGIQDFFGNFVRPSTPFGWEQLKRQGLQSPQQFDPSQLQRPASLPSTNQIK